MVTDYTCLYLSIILDLIDAIMYFRLCDPLDKYKKKDVANLFETLAGNFAEIVQYNKDNRLYTNPERSSITLETLCDIMVNESIKDSVSNFCFCFCYEWGDYDTKRVTNSEPM